MVAIRYGDREIVRTTADKDGVFAAQGLRGGQYQLVTENGQSICRFWAVDTAPPSAQQTALIISGDSIVRGQFDLPGYGPMTDWVEWIKAHPVSDRRHRRRRSRYPHRAFRRFWVQQLMPLAA